MFTGLVETTGVVRRATGDSPRRLVIESALPNDEIVIGESIAIDGCCLTVVEIGRDGLAFEAATETLARTTLGKLGAGARVNLERSLGVAGRLGGHIVTGHVDCVGTVRERNQRGSASFVGVEIAPDVARLTAARGSIALGGVSLTVTEVRGNVFFVALIPHTLAATNLDALQVGDPVNVEADILARYVDRLLEARSAGGSLTEEYLKDNGFL
jgi:riboflavin synthase